MNKISRRGFQLLRLIGKTDDCSLPLTTRYAKAADELLQLRFAEFIHKSKGGADIALTNEGINFLESTEPQPND